MPLRAADVFAIAFRHFDAAAAVFIDTIEAFAT